MTTAYRKHVLAALMPVERFLSACYPCKCLSHPEDDCPGEVAEADEVIRIVLNAVAADIWDDAYQCGMDEDNGGSRLHDNPYKDAS